MGLGDLTKMLGRLKDLQADMQRVQQELANRTAEGTSGAGAVTAVVNGKGQLRSLRIDPEVVNPEDVEMLEDLVVAAVNAAVTRNQQQLKEEMSKLTGGLNLPDLEQLGGMLG